jgi:hypothetical protein
VVTDPTPNLDTIRQRHEENERNGVLVNGQSDRAWLLAEVARLSADLTKLADALRRMHTAAETAQVDEPVWLLPNRIAMIYGGVRPSVLAVLDPVEAAPTAAEPTRSPVCVAAWPECYSGGYDPRCCRFPKSCSCTVRAPATEPQATHDVG